MAAATHTGNSFLIVFDTNVFAYDIYIPTAAIKEVVKATPVVIERGEEEEHPLQTKWSLWYAVQSTLEKQLTGPQY